MSPYLPESYSIDEACRYATRSVDHRCVSVDGGALRAGGSCWFEARTQVLEDGLVAQLDAWLDSCELPPARQPSSSGSVVRGEFGGAEVGAWEDDPASAPSTRLIGDASPCDGCGRHLPDRYALYSPEDERGFCSAACMAVWVRRRYIEVVA